MEIERKFLVPDRPRDLDRCPCQRIVQGYIAVTEDGTEVRVRRREEEATLTVKAGGGRSRLEEEIGIEERRFEALWPLTEGRRIEKLRYLMPAPGGLAVELDVYGGTLSGLVIGEIEFDSEEAAEAFEPPAWLGTEVTDDPRYRNRQLAMDGLPQ